jgi:DNA-binding GntR family transcriptional regulator
MIVDGSVVIDTNELAEAPPRLKVDRAYEELKRLIITLRLAPGSYIDERELMTKFGIGRTPLREAVMRLVQERLIVHTPRRGAWVSPLSITDLQQMLEARVTLDALIARRAAERVTETDIATLRGMLDEARMAVNEGNNEELVDLDFQLHSYIAQCSGNDYFAAFSVQINSAMLRYWHLASRNDQTIPSWANRHQDLVNGIVSGDPDLAEVQARRHVGQLRENLRDLLK